MKPKLTKEERIAHYREAMSRIAESTDKALCGILNDLVGYKAGEPYPNNMLSLRRYYPEVFTIRRIIKYKSKYLWRNKVIGKGGLFWFPLDIRGQVERINLLHRAIYYAKRSKY